MVDIPEHLLLRSAEARAKALGISVEQALAEMKGESEPTVVSKEPEVIVIEGHVEIVGCPIIIKPQPSGAWFNEIINPVNAQNPPWFISIVCPSSGT